MKSPLTELKDYADSIYEMGFMYNPGEVISKLLTLISKLPSASLPSSSVTGEEDKVDILINELKRIHQRYGYESAANAIAEYHSFFDDPNTSTPVTGESEAIGFAEWKDNNYIQHPNGYYSKFNDGSHGKSHLLPKFNTLSELYNLYKQSKK